MEMIENKKSTIILILRVLEEYSDENHFLTLKEIIDLIYNDYGLTIERKAVSRSISILQQLDYDIEKGNRGGYALFSRLFDDSEVRFLVDAIFSSKIIPGNLAQQLANKVSGCLSKYDRKNYNYLLKSSEINRTTNKSVFYNIEIINEAIRKNKWIGFKYLTFDINGKKIHRFDDYVFHASPCYLVNNFGRYYLLAYRYKYNNVNAWRIDYMDDIYVMDERERINPNELDEFKNYSSITDYINDHIYLFGGKVIAATLKLKSADNISYIYDWFGGNSKVYSKDNQVFVNVKCNETALFYWVMQYGECVEVVSPQSLIDRIKLNAETILKKYT